MPVPLPKTDCPLGFLRYLTAEICDGILALSDPDITDAEIEAALEHVHKFCGELWMWTNDIRKGRH